jgi:MFS family permease
MICRHCSPLHPGVRPFCLLASLSLGLSGCGEGWRILKILINPAPLLGDETVQSVNMVADGPTGLFFQAMAFGVAYGGAMPLYALVSREFFGPRVIGTAFGGIFFISCIGMGLGAYTGGFVFDLLGSYWSLHLGSTLVGAAAVGLALGLRRPREAPALAGGS